MLVILYIYVCTYYVFFFFLVKLRVIQKHLDDTEILKAKIGWECLSSGTNVLSWSISWVPDWMLYVIMKNAQTNPLPLGLYPL